MCVSARVLAAPTCGVESSKLAVDAMDVEPGGDLFALLDAGVGAQRAGRLRLHLGGRGVLLQHDRRPAVLRGVGRLLDDAPGGGTELQGGLEIYA